MDSLSQFVLGASVFEAGLGRKLGNKSFFWGGLLGTIPDLDVLSGPFLSELDKIWYHRGPSHSLLFSLLMAVVFMLIITRCHRSLKDDGSRVYWTCFWVFFTHIVLDMCTTWGTKVLWPFSDLAVAWQFVFVVDPLYTLPFLLGWLCLFFLKREGVWRKRLNLGILAMSTGYLLLAFAVKLSMSTVFERQFAGVISPKDLGSGATLSSAVEPQGLEGAAQDPRFRWSSRPAPLSILLWAANAETEDGFYLSYASVFDGSKSREAHFFPKDQKLRSLWAGQKQMQLMSKISGGQMLLREHPEGIVVSDLRFGQIEGWSNPDSDFVFRYLFKGGPEDEEVEVIKLSPESGNRRDALASLWQHMWGLGSL